MERRGLPRKIQELWTEYGLNKETVLSKVSPPAPTPEPTTPTTPPPAPTEEPTQPSDNPTV